MILSLVMFFTIYLSFEVRKTIGMDESWNK